jgi:hypothetical protein
VLRVLSRPPIGYRRTIEPTLYDDDSLIAFGAKASYINHKFNYQKLRYKYIS